MTSWPPAPPLAPRTWADFLTASAACELGSAGVGAAGPTSPEKGAPAQEARLHPRARGSWLFPREEGGVSESPHSWKGSGAERSV